MAFWFHIKDNFSNAQMPSCGMQYSTYQTAVLRLRSSRNNVQSMFIFLTFHSLSTRLKTVWGCTPLSAMSGSVSSQLSPEDYFQEGDTLSRPQANVRRIQDAVFNYITAHASLKFHNIGGERRSVHASKYISSVSFYYYLATAQVLSLPGFICIHSHNYIKNSEFVWRD